LDPFGGGKVRPGRNPLLYALLSRIQRGASPRGVLCRTVVPRKGPINYRKKTKGYYYMFVRLSSRGLTRSFPSGARPSSRGRRDQVPVDNFPRPATYPQVASNRGRDQVPVGEDRRFFRITAPDRLTLCRLPWENCRFRSSRGRDQAPVSLSREFKALPTGPCRPLPAHDSLGALALGATGGGLCDSVRPWSSAVIRAVG
jgi:hypothetical protein